MEEELFSMSVRSSKNSIEKLICMDVGNSFLKIAVLEGKSVSELARIGSSLSFTRIRSSIEALAQSKRISDIDGVVLCSVVPALNSSLRSLLNRVFPARLLFISCRLKLPFAIAVKNPRKVGADRLCAIAGALGPRRRSCIVIDLGSAITVDVVSSGRFKGGFILPGPELALSALSSRTGKLPKINLNCQKAHPHLSINDTEEAMISGIFTSIISGIKGAVRELEKREMRTLPKVLSGGGYSWLSSGLPESWRFDLHLVFKGMKKIWRFNNTHHL